MTPKEIQDFVAENTTFVPPLDVVEEVLRSSQNLSLEFGELDPGIPAGEYFAIGVLLGKAFEMYLQQERDDNEKHGIDRHSVISEH